MPYLTELEAETGGTSYLPKLRHRDENRAGMCTQTLPVTIWRYCHKIRLLHTTG